MLKVLGLVTMVAAVMLVLGSGAPNLAQAIFDDQIESVGDFFKGVFNDKKHDPIYPNPANEGQRIINDLYAHHPNIQQKDVDIAYRALSDDCLQSTNKPDNPFGPSICDATSHGVITGFIRDWGYNYLVDIPTSRAPQLYVDRP